MSKPQAFPKEILADGFVGRLLPLVPDGKYQLQMDGWWTGCLFGKSQKIAVKFKICDPGDYFGCELLRWYNVALRGKTGRNGGFAAPFNGDLVKEYAHLMGSPRRFDRIALSKYREFIIVGTVCTVTTDRRQQVRHDALRYSVVRSLDGVAAGRRAIEP